MPYWFGTTREEYPGQGAALVAFIDSNSFGECSGFLFDTSSGTLMARKLPAAGADVDGVTLPDSGDGTAGSGGIIATPGLPVLAKSAAAWSVGALLQVQADGRFITQTTGKAVLRALEAATAANQLKWCVFTSGR